MTILTPEMKKILLRPSEDPTRGYICADINPAYMDKPILFNGKTFRRSHLTAEFHAATKMAMCLGVKLMDDNSDDVKGPCGANARMVEVDSKQMLQSAPLPYLLICDNKDRDCPATKEASECRKTPDLVLGHKDSARILKACLYQFGTMSLEEIVEHLDLYFATDDISKETELGGTFIGVIHFNVDNKTSYARLVLGHGRLVGIYSTYLRARNQLGKPLKFSPVALTEALKASPGMCIDLCRPVKSAPGSAAPAADTKETLDYRDIKVVLTALVILGACTPGVQQTMKIAPASPGNKAKFTIEKISLAMGDPKKAFHRVLGFVWADTTQVKSDKTAVSIMVNCGGDEGVRIGYMKEEFAKSGRARLAFSDSENRIGMFLRVIDGLSVHEMIAYASDWLDRLQPIDFDEKYAEKLDFSLRALMTAHGRLYEAKQFSDTSYIATLTGLFLKAQKILTDSGKKHALGLQVRIRVAGESLISQVLGKKPVSAFVSASDAAEAEAAALAKADAAEMAKTEELEQSEAQADADGDVPMEPYVDEKKEEEGKEEEKSTKKTASSASAASAGDSTSMSLLTAASGSSVVAAAAVFVPPPPPPPPSPARPPLSVPIVGKPDKEEKKRQQQQSLKRKADNQSQSQDEDLSEAEKLFGEMLESTMPPPDKKSRVDPTPNEKKKKDDSVIDLTHSVGSNNTNSNSKPLPDPVCRICARPDSSAMFVCGPCGCKVSHGGGMPDELSQLKFLVSQLISGQERMEAELKRIRGPSSVKMDES